MTSKLKTIYKTGAWVSGVAVCGTTIFYMHPHFKECVTDLLTHPPFKHMTYDEFIKTRDEFIKTGSHKYHDDTTCASRIVDYTLSYPVYLMDRVFSYESPRILGAGCVYFGLQGAVGFSVGLGVGLLWPISVPLIALEIAETKYGYKLC
jgi:hypothetical protein